MDRDEVFDRWCQLCDLVKAVGLGDAAVVEPCDNSVRIRRSCEALDHTFEQGEEFSPARFVGLIAAYFAD